MNISTVTAASTSATASATPEKTNLDYGSFLKLLVTQLKNQDPTKPMDSTEYIAQLATFSNVEQAISANKKLDELIQDSKMSQGIGLIGKHVASLDGVGSGMVEKVRFGESGILATLTDGSEVAIDQRVTISQ